MRGFLEAFNDRREKVVKPGADITVDECMSAWDGTDFKWTAEGMPHVTKIARKPKGIGCELKSACDGESGIMLRLEIQEGAEAMKDKKWANMYKYHTAVTLRLTEPWHGSNRTVNGDSAFASFVTAIALLGVGLFFRGIVKTASSLFPMKWFKRWGDTNPRRGANVQVKTTTIVGGVSRAVMAIGWMCKLPKYFVSTCGNGLAAAVQKVQRTKRVLVEGIWDTEHYTKETAWPNMVRDLFVYFSVIDVHDHYRQGTLAMEVHIKTKCWWLRVFSTIIGMIYTDAYFMYRHDYRSTHYGTDVGMETFEEWLGKLAYQMIWNTLIQCESRSKRSRGEGEEADKVRKH